MLAIITGKTIEQHRRRPDWPFCPNWNSQQARGLKCWVPMGVPDASDNERDLVGGLTFTNTNTVNKSLLHEGCVRLFDDAASEYLENLTAVVTAVPLTFACWFSTDTVTIAETLMSLGVVGSSSTNRFQMQVEGTVAGDPIRTLCNQSNPSSQADSTKGAIANKVHHAVGAYSSATVYSYLDGGNVGTVSNGDVPAGIDATYIGTRRLSGSNGAFWSGNIWDARIYNVTKSDIEVYQMFDRPVELFYPLRHKVFSFPSAGGTVYTQSLTGTLSLSATITKLTAKGLTATLSLSATLAKQDNQALSGSLSLSAALAKLTDKALTGALSLTGATITMLAILGLTGALALSATLVKATAKAITGSLSLSATVANLCAKGLTGALSMGATLANMAGKGLSGTLALSGSLVKLAMQGLSAALSLSATLAKLPMKALTGALSLAGSLSTSITGAVYVAGAMAWRVLDRMVSYLVGDRGTSYGVRDRGCGHGVENRATSWKVRDRDASEERGGR